MITDRKWFISVLLLVFLFLPGITKSQQKHTLSDSVFSIDTSNTEEEVVSPVIDSSASVTPAVEDTATNTAIPDTVIFREVDDRTVKKFQRNKDFEYANDPEYWKKEKPVQKKKANSMNQFLQGDTFRYLIYTFMIAVLLFVLFKVIAENKLHLFYRKPVKASAVITDETPEDIYDESLDEKLQKALKAGEYRMAIRFAYLKSLKLLDAKQMIHYHADTTNAEYVRSLKQTLPGNQFAALTRVYEYTWYGNFPVSDQQFETVIREFNHFYTLI